MLNLDHEIRINGTHELTYEEVRKVVGKYKNVYVDGYVSIGEGAFEGSSIRNLRIGKSIIGIKDKAFKGVKSLTNIIFDEGSNLKTIGYQSFYSTSLEDVTLPVSTTVLFDEAFAHCKSLRSITLSGNNLIYIGYNVFKDSSMTYFTAYNNQLNSLNLIAGITNKIGGKENITVYSLDSPEEVTTLLTNNLLNSVDTTHTIDGIGELTPTIVQNNIDDGSSAVDVIITGFTSIGRSAFKNSGLSGSITLPASLTSIGNDGFGSCSNLTSVNLEELTQLATIGYAVFQKSGLSGSITLPASLTEIGSSAFQDCSSLTSVSFEPNSQLDTIGAYVFQKSGLSGSITLPASLTEIGSSAFQDCSSLTSVSFENGSQLATIGTYAFYQSGLSGSITFPASLTRIGDNAFYNSSSTLTSVSFEPNSQLDTIGRFAFGRSGMTSITLPASVTILDAAAFHSCTALTSVNFESGSQLTTIGSTVFAFSGLSGITLPASLTSIGNNAFRQCSSLTSVSFESGSQLETIGGSSVFILSGLSSFTAPQSVLTLFGVSVGTNKTVGDKAGVNVYLSRSSTIIDGTDILTPTIVQQHIGDGSSAVDVIITGFTSIGDNAFQSSDLSGSITLPASVKSIGFKAFSSCSSLTSVNFKPNSQLTMIGSHSFRESGLTSITLPSSVTSIGSLAFESCSSLTSVNFNELVLLDTIDVAAFQYSGLSGSITLPASLTNLKGYAFSSCSSLTSVSFESGSQLETIGDSVFANSNITSFTAPQSVLDVFGVTVGINKTVGDKSGVTVTVILKTIVVTTGMNNIGMRMPGAIQGNNILNVYVHNPVQNGYDEITKTSSDDNGEYYILQENKGYWVITNNSVPLSIIPLENITVYSIDSPEESTTRVTNNLLSSVNTTHTIHGTGPLTSAIVQNNIGDGSGAVDVIITGYSTIGEGAFTQSAGLSGSITLPASLTSIGGSAFRDCSSLTSVIFESGSQLETIDGAAFRNSGLSGSITLPVSVTSIGLDVFRECSSLTSVNINELNQLATINNYVFKLSGLNGSITLPASVTRINKGAFESCSNLSGVNFASGSQLESIGDYVFKLSGLNIITLPASLTTIGSYAFWQCSNLTTVRFDIGSQLPSIGTAVFGNSYLTVFIAPQYVLDAFNVEAGENKTVGGKSNVEVFLKSISIDVEEGMNLIGMHVTGTIGGENILSIHKYVTSTNTYVEIAKSNNNKYQIEKQKGYWVKTNSANPLIVTDI